MKLVIAGDIDRGKQWEKYLRERASVREVIVTPEFRDEETDAVVLLNDSPFGLTKVIQIIKKGYPVYLVSRLPTDIEELKKVYHASEEANVSVQFSHWTSFSSITRYMRKYISSGPQFIEIRKADRGRTVPPPDKFRQAWVDELALIVTLQNSSVQQITAKPVKLQNLTAGIHLSIRFDSGSVATIQYMAVSPAESYERTVQSNNSLFVCDILAQKTTRYAAENGSSLLQAEHKTFDSTDTALNSLDYFIRSVKTRKPSGFSALNALQTARLASRIDELIKKA